MIIHAFKLGFLGKFKTTALEPCRIEPQQIRMTVEFRVSIEAITSKNKKTVMVTQIHMIKYKFLKESTTKRELQWCDVEKTFLKIRHIELIKSVGDNSICR